MKKDMIHDRGMLKISSCLNTSELGNIKIDGLFLL